VDDPPVVGPHLHRLVQRKMRRIWHFGDLQKLDIYLSWDDIQKGNRLPEKPLSGIFFKDIEHLMAQQSMSG
jgi:hypothetical protein